MVNAPARVGTAAFSCKTRTVRAGMRHSIAVELLGNILLTVTESFSEYYAFRAEKIGKTCGSMCFLWNISLLLSSP